MAVVFDLECSFCTVIVISMIFLILFFLSFFRTFSALMLLAGQQEGHPA